MEFKINEGSIDQSSQRKRNNIFRRFRSPLTALLSQTRNRQQFPKLDDIYIKNESLHEQLDYFFKDNQNIAQFLIGLTGIGKTTTIKGYFGIDRSAAKIKNNILILPLFVDGAAIYESSQVEKRLASLFWNACKELDSNLKYEVDEFYKFIYTNSPHVLAEHEESNDINNSSTLENLKKNAPRAFYLELLKYYFLCNNIQSVILIIDDIESIRNSEILSEFVHLAAKSWDCLQNNDSGVFVKLLIAERPETHANLFRNATWFSAFGFRQDTIDLITPPSLSAIFKKRFDYLIKSSSGNPAKDMEEWNIAYGVLMDICNDISVNNQEIIISLCNYNLRKSFGILLEILTAGFWVQKDENVEPYFKLRKGQFRRSGNILILKALGYRNNEYYINGKNQIISNLLHYRRNCAYPLLTIQLVCCFLYENKKAGHRFIVIDKSKLLKRIKKAVTPKIDRNLEEAIEYSMKYLLEQKILILSSCDDGSKNYIYLSPKGEILWKLMGKNTILLELFRDDMWLKREEHLESTIRLKTLDDKFYEVIQLSRKLLSEEKENINDLIEADSLGVYHELFGETLVSNHISKGVIESLNRFYNSTKNEEPSKIAEVSLLLSNETEELMTNYLEV